MKLTTKPPRDLSLPPSRFQVLCSNPFCSTVVAYRGETCKQCQIEQATERARLQAQKDPR